MKLIPRKLLAAAAPMTLAAALAACGHATPGMRATSFPAPVTEASVSPKPAPAPTPAVAAVVPLVMVDAMAAIATPDPAYATPMCDANGRPLAGNVRTKNASNMCTEPTQ